MKVNIVRKIKKHIASQNEAEDVGSVVACQLSGRFPPNRYSFPIHWIFAPPYTGASLHFGTRPRVCGKIFSTFSLYCKRGEVPPYL